MKCEHVEQIKNVDPKSEGCEECTKTGDEWVQLRLCLACGHVGCCDSSKGKHSTEHYKATGHPIIEAFKEGKKWRWCFVDKGYVE